MFFTEQLALLLETGTSLHPALVSIREQMQDSPMATVIDAIAEGVMGGASLSEKMSEHPKVFSSTYVSLVAASEQGGFLHEVLEQLRGMDEQNAELKASLVSAFSYPVFLVGFSIFVLFFILLVVFPRFGQMFASIGDQLPVTTRVLMATSDYLLNNWETVAGALAVTTAAGVWWLRSPSGIDWVARMKLGAPLLGGIWRRVYLIVAFRVLGLSLKHGVSLVQAVRTARDIVDNGLVQRFFVDLGVRLEQGGRLGEAFSQAWWVPDLAKQMVSTAEESGSLPQVLLRVSDYYRRELDRLLIRVSKMVEPIMLVVMGGLVGLLVSALILPIFKMSQAVH
ncbi:MAG: type II secretion system F family protein [Pseudomonadales bacterium]|nr:type II secretion system F family protein [Pseudomonadales bacterium]MCP5185853.1 type II secretion system F family protein [Pseudomonadales bacterium]